MDIIFSVLVFVGFLALFYSFLLTVWRIVARRVVKNGGAELVGTIFPGKFWIASIAFIAAVLAAFAQGRNPTAMENLLTPIAIGLLTLLQACISEKLSRKNAGNPQQ